MESNQSHENKQEEEVFDLGNFSDYDENEDQETCGGDNKHKSETKKNKKVKTCQDGTNKTCTTECQGKVTEALVDPSRLCKKCKINKGTLLYRSEATCKECFLSAMEHRFRSSLRTQVKLSKKDDEVLCCLSGGQNSLAMCRMISESLFNPGPRKMFFKAQAIHINEAAAMNISEEEEGENISKIKTFQQKYKLEVAILNIEDIYDVQSEHLADIVHKSYDLKSSHSTKEVVVLSKIQKREKLQKLLGSLSDLGSAKEDVLSTLKKLLIMNFALQNNISKVFFADTAQKVAINSLTLLCKGRGADIFDKVVPEEKIFSHVTSFRPMNDFLTKEILVYDHFNKLAEFFIVYPKLEDVVPNSRRYPGNGSINTLLENFVDKLQAGFPSTVHTVLNTLNKIKPKFNEKKICPVCWGRKDKLGNILEKGSIIQYLKIEPKDSSVADQKNIELKNTIDMDFESKKIKKDYLDSDYFKSKSSLEKVACFSCGRIFENAKDETALVENFPDVIKHNAESLCQQAIPKNLNQEAFDYYFYDYDCDI